MYDFYRARQPSPGRADGDELSVPVEKTLLIN